MVTSALVAVGSNLGDPRYNIERAVQAMQEKIGDLTVRSSLYQTAALVPEGEDSTLIPDYLNGVVQVRTAMSPSDVLRALLEIERQLGRVRGITEKRWQPRVIDLDLLAMDSVVVSSTELTLPHPELHRRDFVLVPLVEVAPEWKHPILEKTSCELLEQLESQGYQRFVKGRVS